MAQRAHALAGNAPGSFFVDASCIDCGTCYSLVPEVFRDAGGHSLVDRQPTGALERRRASMAVLACPTASIGTDDKSEIAAATAAFPSPIEGEVSFCGYTSEASFGAWSYFIQRPAGNVLMDSPRAAGPLLTALDARGGVATMVLSHRDDVAHHAAFRRRFGCDRIMHRADRVAGLERYLDGKDPVRLAEDLVFIPTPGHTQGSACLLYRDAFLFTGDHLYWNPDARRLSASKAMNWYSWPDQLRSLERLLDFEFRWVLPGHGSSFRADSPRQMRAELERALLSLRRA
jgi:glyoxylase-like metal-dependent hydrolase (beta-lactamase superfamily II)/ferredoxin